MIKYRENNVILTYTYTANEVPPTGFYISESGLLCARYPEHRIVFDTHLGSLGVRTMEQLKNTLHKPQLKQIEFTFDTNPSSEKQLLKD